MSEPILRLYTTLIRGRIKRTMSWVLTVAAIPDISPKINVFFELLESVKKRKTKKLDKKNEIAWGVIGSIAR